MLRALIVTAGLCAAMPAAAAVVANDFEAENGGVTALNYAGFADIDVDGSVDLVHTGDGFGIVCAGGSFGCVDLDGSPGPGILSATLPSPGGSGVYAVTISFDVSGNQRGGADDELFFGINFGAGPLIGPTFTVLADDMFQTFGLVVDFVTTSGGSWTGFVGTTSGDAIGPIIDNFRFEVSERTDLPAPGALALFGLGALALRVARRG